jgi:hypothetical protein
MRLEIVRAAHNFLTVSRQLLTTSNFFVNFPILFIPLNKNIGKLNYLYAGISGKTGKFPREPGELPREPGELPREPGELPREPGELPREAGELPREPGELPRVIGELPELYVNTVSLLKK